MKHQLKMDFKTVKGDNINKLHVLNGLLSILGFFLPARLCTLLSVDLLVFTGSCRTARPPSTNNLQLRASPHYASLHRILILIPRFLGNLSLGSRWIFLSSYCWGFMILLRHRHKCLKRDYI